MKQINLQENLRKKFIKLGVKMVAPETVFFSKDTKIGKNVFIEPYVVIGQKVKINNNVIIHSFSHLENTNLENEISYNYSKDDMYVDVKANVFEDLTVKDSARYEYILPNIFYEKSFLTEKFGTFDFKSNAYYKNFETNKHTTFLVNDVIWNPAAYITPKGFVNSLKAMVKNTNYSLIYHDHFSYF